MEANNLAGVQEEIQCPLCQKVIKETRISVRCLHRFCKTCIELWIRATGSLNKYCPVCQTTIQSKRDFKEDKRFDKFLNIWTHTFPQEFLRQEVVSIEDKSFQSNDSSIVTQGTSKSCQIHKTDTVDLSKSDDAFPRRQKRKHNSNQLGEQQKRKTDSMTSGYATSLKIVMKPILERKQIQNDEPLMFRLQKSTKLVTICELVCAHVAVTTGDERYQKGNISLFTGSTEYPELIQDLSNTIGSISKHTGDEDDTRTFLFAITLGENSAI